MAVSSGAFLLLSHHFASLGRITDDAVRSCSFVVVGVTVGWLSEAIGQATTRIRENEALFRSVFDGIQDVFYRTDAEGRVILISPSVQQATGYTAEEVIGQPATRFYVDPTQRDILLEELSQKDTVTDLEINLRHNDGTVILTSVTSHIMKDDEGRVLGVEGILRNITERKLVEEALREEKDRAQKYLDVAGVMLAVVDADEQISLMNNKGCEVLGYSEREVIGQNWFDLLIPERLREEVRGVFRQLLAGQIEPVEYYENALLTKDGQERIIAFHNTVLTDEDGGIYAALCSGEDITERKRAEAALAASATQWQNTFDAIEDLVVIIDKNFRVLRANRAVANAFPDTEVRGVHCYELFHGLDSPLPNCASCQVFQTQEPAHAEICEAHLGYHWLDCYSYPIRGLDGAVEQVAHVIRDITARKQTEDELKALRDHLEELVEGRTAELERTNRELADEIAQRKHLQEELIQATKMAALGTMAGGIAHEVRNPLAIISSCNQLFQEHSHDQQVRARCVEKIDAACQRASLIVENLLAFASSQEWEWQPEEANLNAVLERAIALLAHNMEQQRITLRKDFQPDLPNVRGGPDLLEQVFVNLMLNAAAAMPQGGRLMLTTGATEVGEVTVEFADTGRGITPEHLPKIFDPFFTTMSPGQGTGLGLAISYSIIQQHKGTIEVESQRGQGSTFTVRLPATEE